MFIFTRLFSPHDYGVYLLGVGFASVVSVFLVGWFRNLILSGHARNDGTDVRGLVISGYLVCCLTAPVAYVHRPAGRTGCRRRRWPRWAVDRDRPVRTDPGSGSRAADGLLGHEGDAGPRRRVLGFGVVAALVGPTGFLLLLSSALAYLLAVLVQSRTAWRGTHIKFDRAALAALARTGLPLTLSLTLLAISSVTDRFMIANLVGDRRRRQICRRPRSGPADADDAGDERGRGLLSARGADPRQARRRRGAYASCRMRRAACSAITLPACLGFAVISAHVANVMLGADFRELAAQTMPIIAVAVIFQILTQQYLHASFLLSGRNSSI